MEAGHIQLRKEKILTRPYIERIAKKFSSLALDENINFEYDIKSDAYIYIDPDRIEQVLTNLIDNAFRHSEEQGTVKITVEEKQDVLVVHVSDNGSGIPEEDLPFIFERFYKGDKARTRNSEKKGTGLGLSIVKHIIEEHDGSIYATSEVNKGTTFTFTLPLNDKNDDHIS